jgi:hypothetical protein
MSVSPLRFPYVPRDPSHGIASLTPMLPLTLIGRQSVATTGLVDSGAAVNVLPLALGVQLEFDVCFFRSQSVFEVRPKP